MCIRPIGGEMIPWGDINPELSSATSGYFSVSYNSSVLSEKDSNFLSRKTDVCNIDYVNRIVYITLCECITRSNNQLVGMKILSQLLKNDDNLDLTIVKRNSISEHFFPKIILQECKFETWVDINDISKRDYSIYDVRFKFEKVKFQWQ